MTYPNPTGNQIGSFQTRVNLYNPLAVAGDFASANPRATVLTPEAAFVAGPNGVMIGKFAWVAADGVTVNNYASAGVTPDGFVHRDQQGLLTEYLQAAGLLIPPGFPVTLMADGDFWATNLGVSSLAPRSPIYAGYADGGIYSAAPAGASVTATLGSTNTGSLGATFTASAGSPDTELVVTAVTGLISIGDTVSGTGITAGTTILSQISGTAGGAGTYGLSAANTCSAATVTSFGSVLDLTVVSTYVSVGDTVVKSTDFPSGVTITAQLTGTTGGVGTYQLSAPATAYVASGTGVLTFGITFKVTAVGSGTLAVGDAVTDTSTAANVATGATIASQVNGTPGSTGVYTLSLSSAAAGTYAAGDTLTTAGGIETSFVAKSVAAVGELVQMSTWGN